MLSSIIDASYPLSLPGWIQYDTQCIAPFWSELHQVTRPLLRWCWGFIFINHRRPFLFSNNSMHPTVCLHCGWTSSSRPSSPSSSVAMNYGRMESRDWLRHGQAICMYVTMLNFTIIIGVTIPIVAAASARKNDWRMFRPVAINLVFCWRPSYILCYDFDNMWQFGVGFGAIQWCTYTILKAFMNQKSSHLNLLLRRVI